MPFIISVGLHIGKTEKKTKKKRQQVSVYWEFTRFKQILFEKKKKKEKDNKKLKAIQMLSSCFPLK